MCDGAGLRLLSLDDGVSRDNGRSIAIAIAVTVTIIVALILVTIATVAGPRGIVARLQWYNGIVWLVAADDKRRLVLDDGLW
jgi:hypothetical protein